MRLRIVAILLMAALPAAAQESVKVYAAGSLSAALRAAGGIYSSTHPDTVVNFEFGPSGMLKDRLAAGEKADLFASADMALPESLHSPANRVPCACSQGTSFVRWPIRKRTRRPPTCSTGCSTRR